MVLPEEQPPSRLDDNAGRRPERRRAVDVLAVTLVAMLTLATVLAIVAAVH